jgi:hypothetical protein
MPAEGCTPEAPQRRKGAESKGGWRFVPAEGSHARRPLSNIRNRAPFKPGRVRHPRVRSDLSR